MRLKELRKNIKMTQTEVAEFLKVPRSTYSNYENDNSEPTIATLIKLSKLFGVTVDYLLGADNGITTNELDKELLSYTNQLNDLEKAKVIGYAKSRVEQQKEDRYNTLRNKLEE